MTVAAHHYHPVRPGPLHALLLAGSVPLFIGGLLSDIAYYQTQQIQWANFAAWLIAGALLLSGLALLFALGNLFGARFRGRRPAAYFLLLLLAWVLGLVNAFEQPVVTITNEGNATDYYTLNATDNQYALSYDLPDEPVACDPGRQSSRGRRTVDRGSAGQHS